MEASCRWLPPRSLNLPPTWAFLPIGMEPTIPATVNRISADATEQNDPLSNPSSSGCRHFLRFEVAGRPKNDLSDWSQPPIRIGHLRRLL